MKRLKLLLAGLLLATTTATYADNDRPIAVDQLPQAAQQMIRQHFADRRVALAKRESEFMKKSYEVIFADGCRIEFDGQGEWKEIDCRFAAVPAAAVPAPIAQYVKNNYPDAMIVKIEKDRREYEVKLSNRLELTFDRAFRLVDIDD
ncbi:MAG: PepSY-like domain-containing protein [Alistipes sp.]|nr:PepSY-like domain-containing protein [Alistipes sp.]